MGDRQPGDEPNLRRCDTRPHRGRVRRPEVRPRRADDLATTPPVGQRDGGRPVEVR